MSVLQPVDDRGNPVPVLPIAQTAINLAFGAASARTATPVVAIPAGSSALEVIVVTLVSTAACRFVIGDSAVVASSSSPYLPAGLPFDVAMQAGQYIAALQDAAGGTLVIMPRR